MAADRQRLDDNVATIRRQIAEAAVRSGRDDDAIKLVAVTKYVDTNVTRRLVQAGCRILGESRPQALWQKAETLADLDIEWHMIGHLQRNKIRRTLPLIHCLHSADSPRLLHALHDEAQRIGMRLKVLLEVNISGDREKTGLLPQDAVDLADVLEQWSALDICGLMAMSGRDSLPEQARRQFIQVRELRDEMVRTSVSGITLPELSMGMSGDYVIAIEEGATMVRVGSALFDGVPK